MRDAYRILWLCPKLPYPLVSGERIRHFNLIRRLATRHAVHLVSFQERPDDAEFVPVLEKFCEQVVTVPLPRRQPLPQRMLAAMNPRRSFYVHRYTSPTMRHAVESISNRWSYDVVQAENIFMTQYLRDVNQRSRPARIVTLINIESILCERCSRVESHPLKRVYWRLEAAKLASLEHRQLGGMDAVVTMSEHDRGVVQRMVPGAHVFTVANSVDTEEYQVPPEIERERSVVFTGSLGYQPNADAVAFFLDEVWHRVRRAVPDGTCQIVGRDPSRALLSRSGTDGVVVTGHVDDVRPYLARAGATIVPLRAGAGTRLKILEAMATGNGIVSTRIGAEGLDVRDGVDLLLADDPAAFAQAVIRVLTDPELRRRLGTSARQRVETRYDWDIATTALEAVYRAVVKLI
jgi:sugar transferase (PEP-CTERM/EpsH1 system associated)